MTQRHVDRWNDRSEDALALNSMLYHISYQCRNWFKLTCRLRIENKWCKRANVSLKDCQMCYNMSPKSSSINNILNKAHNKIENIQQLIKEWLGRLRRNKKVFSRLLKRLFITPRDTARWKVYNMIWTSSLGSKQKRAIKAILQKC